MLPAPLQPRFWGVHLIALVCVAAATLMGLWQYDAWGDRRAEEARDLSAAQPRQLTVVMSGDDPFPGQHVGRPVTLRGAWLGDDTVFVSDRRLEGQVGYWVVTPVLVEGAGSAMPVVRGWSTQPQAPQVQGDVELTGWLQPGEGSGRVDEDPHDAVIPEMRIPSLVEHVDSDLYSGFVVARGLGEPTLRQVTPDSIPEISATTALRNLLYALEWWVFAGFALFLWWRWCRDEIRSAAAQEPSVASTP